MGLGRRWLVQYLAFATNVFAGELGKSFYYQMPGTLTIFKGQAHLAIFEGAVGYHGEPAVLLGAAPAAFQPRGGPSTPKSWHYKKSGAEHSIQRHSSSPIGLSGGCAKPIFDHAHERSAKRQGERGLILCPLSSNLPYRARRVELRLQRRRKTEEAGFELSVPRDMTKVLKTSEIASA
jgi:hypothetical protein